MRSVTIPYLPHLGSLSIEHANALLDEVGSSVSIDSLNWQSEYPYMPLTSVFLAHDGKAAYIKWHVNGIMLKGVHTEDLQPVHEDSCVEFFCMMPDQRHYINFEFNCIGTCSASRRLSKTDDVVRLSKEQLSAIERYSTLGRRPFCEIEGQFVWSLTVKIPLWLLLDLRSGEDDSIEDILRHNYTTKGNLYKCADDTSSKHYVSWNPIVSEKPMFHCPEQFGEIRFETIG